MARRIDMVLATLGVLGWFAATAVPQDPPEQWGVHEIVLEGPSAGNPYLDVRLSAHFSRGTERVEVPGFWDGGGAYTIRFSPPSAGEWRYETRSNRPELDGKTGSFAVAPPSAGNHGPVRVAHTWHFAYADGTPYFQVGTTCYVWTHQPEELQRRTLQTLAKAPFNKIRFCIFPKAYSYNRNEPALFAFEKGGDGKFDFTRPVPAFWRNLEGRIRELRNLGIEADLILWHPYDRWGFSEMGRENDDRYLRYCIARLGAFRNVWWSLANEYDLMRPRAAQGHRGDKTMDDWDRFFRILRDEDPHGRLRSIHNCHGFYDHAQPWVTHASIQSHDLPAVLKWRETYRKPVVVDECGYEGDIPQGWGKPSAEEMVRRFWIGALRGGYVGHGETYRHPEEILWWSKGGTLHGQSPARIAFLKEILGRVAFHEFTPRKEPAPGHFLLEKEGEACFLYSTRSSPATLTLAGPRAYKVDGIDPWGMREVSLGSAEPGPFTARPPKADYLLRFTAYAPGEPPRPEVVARASVTEGRAPLEVRFSVEAPGRVRWDFGDGRSSEERTPVHTFREPGLYTVEVTVTDAPGGVATRFLTIAADRDASLPLVRAGFAEGETHPVALRGSAARAPDGGFRLAPEAPWGWAAVGEAPIAGLEGLRSFTLCGWLKASSLKSGPGGNRILFNLKGRTSGFDLVHLDDGRLRLSVNEWPDDVRNDSSAGRVRAGEWIFFAVTYDAAGGKGNVGWYFGAPDRPAELDRRTTYAAGPTGAGSGRLTAGNYNETMHAHGLDRQFRGELRGLEIFGSRIGPAGILDPDAVRARQEASRPR